MRLNYLRHTLGPLEVFISDISLIGLVGLASCLK